MLRSCRLIFDAFLALSASLTLSVCPSFEMDCCRRDRARSRNHDLAAAVVVAMRPNRFAVCVRYLPAYAYVYGCTVYCKTHIRLSCVHGAAVQIRVCVYISIAIRVCVCVRARTKHRPTTGPWRGAEKVLCHTADRTCLCWPRGPCPSRSDRSTRIDMCVAEQQHNSAQPCAHVVRRAAATFQSTPTVRGCKSERIIA